MLYTEGKETEEGEWKQEWDEESEVTEDMVGTPSGVQEAEYLPWDERESGQVTSLPEVFQL